MKATPFWLLAAFRLSCRVASKEDGRGMSPFRVLGIRD
jgi:hypothetical protein